MATFSEVVATLTKLATELDRRRPFVQEYEDAYRGDHKLQYAPEDFSEFFGGRYRGFADNWCGIVADAPTERLQAIGIRLPGSEGSDADLWDVWRRNDADQLSDLAFLDSIIGQRSFALVWGNPDTDEPVITWEHATQAIVGYDPETRRPKAAAKIWVDDVWEYATLFLPDEVWKLQRRKLAEGGRTESGLYLSSRAAGGSWEPRAGVKGVIPNPLGEIPLVELPNRPRLIGEPMSDIAGTLAMQRAINLLWSELFLAADNASWPQKVITGAEMPKIPVLDENGNQVGEKAIDLKKFSVNRAIWIEDPTAKVSEWSAANLEGYTKVIENAVGHIAAQTRTPAHYLLIGGTMANVSSDAMKALETGLVKRTEEKAAHFGRAIRQIFRLVAKVEGNDAKADAVSLGEVLWQDIENRSDAQRADALQKKKAIGYPLQYILELDGLPPAEIKRVMGMVEDEVNDPILSQALAAVQMQGSQEAPVSDDASERDPAQS